MASSPGRGSRANQGSGGRPPPGLADLVSPSGPEHLAQAVIRFNFARRKPPPARAGGRIWRPNGTSHKCFCLFVCLFPSDWPVSQATRSTGRPAPTVGAGPLTKQLDGPQRCFRARRALLLGLIVAEIVDRQFRLAGRVVEASNWPPPPTLARPPAPDRPAGQPHPLERNGPRRQPRKSARGHLIDLVVMTAHGCGLDGLNRPSSAPAEASRASWPAGSRCGAGSRPNLAPPAGRSLASLLRPYFSGLSGLIINFVARQASGAN